MKYRVKGTELIMIEIHRSVARVKAIIVPGGCYEEEDALYTVEMTNDGEVRFCQRVEGLDTYLQEDNFRTSNLPEFMAIMSCVQLAQNKYFPNLVVATDTVIGDKG